jgi:1-acyl-sn-glycerol-3-phosphate acyltransferase
MSRIRREARRLARAARLLAHFATGVVTAYPVFSLFEVTGFDRQRRRREAIVRAWMRVLLRILNVRLNVRGNIQPGAMLYCANHVSWLDIPCLRAVVDAAFVAKSEVRRWPLVGGLAARASTLFLKRGNHDATSQIADRMTWLLAAGKPVIVFPEGTSTDGATVLRLHARLYQAATRVHGYAQAVAVRYPRGQEPTRRLRSWARTTWRATCGDCSARKVSRRNCISAPRWRPKAASDACWQMPRAGKLSRRWNLTLM